MQMLEVLNYVRPLAYQLLTVLSLRLRRIATRHPGGLGFVLLSPLTLPLPLLVLLILEKGKLLRNLVLAGGNSFPARLASPAISLREARPFVMRPRYSALRPSQLDVRFIAFMHLLQYP